MGDLAVLTKDPRRVMEQYSSGRSSDFLTMASFPAYGNEEGTVLLLRRDGPVIDRMRYDAGMHHPLLKMVEGVSLERIHPDRASADATSWHSASSGCGFATPALRNSQYSAVDEKAFDLWVDPAVFSPDNDGFEDVVNIGYRFDSPGFMASVFILDAGGRPVRTLVNNMLLGSTGTFAWDGITDDRQKASIGIYVICFEAFDMSGRIERNLVSVVLAGRIR
jgi:hypothetical protein